MTADLNLIMQNALIDYEEEIIEILLWNSIKDEVNLYHKRQSDKSRNPCYRSLSVVSLNPDPGGRGRMDTDQTKPNSGQANREQERYTDRAMERDSARLRVIGYSFFNGYTSDWVEWVEYIQVQRKKIVKQKGYLKIKTNRNVNYF